MFRQIRHSSRRHETTIPTVVTKRGSVNCSIGRMQPLFGRGSEENEDCDDERLRGTRTIDRDFQVDCLNMPRG